MVYKKSIFSWYPNPLLQSESTLKFLSNHQITDIYQMISPNEAPITVLNFLNTATKYNLDVYFLIGEPEWALDSQAKEAIKNIQKLPLYNKRVKGIVLDIEPHTLDEFKHHPNTIMSSFVSALESCYKVAKRENFEVIVCIPYFLDTLGYSLELERIIAKASDKIAVMNYYKGKEIDHIQTEARLTEKHRKALVNIYELQPPGKHGLTDRNTYYNYGLKAVDQNFSELSHTYRSVDVNLAYHELLYFTELTKRTQK